MPIEIVKNDITKMKVDVIVNAANSSLLGGSGVDGAIHRAAGKELLYECRLLGGCKTGDAKITKGYKLPCRYIIHTVGPVWRDGMHGEEELLISCYKKSLELAHEYKCESIAFPLISSGIFGYPKDKALKAAVEAISGFISEHDMNVYIVILNRESFQIEKTLFSELSKYIDENYVESIESIGASEEAIRFESSETELADEDLADLEPLETFSINEETIEFEPSETKSLEKKELHYESWESVSATKDKKAFKSVKSAPDAEKKKADISMGALGEIVNQLDESFSQMLLRKIDDKGMTDAECYKKANISRKLFSKIRGDINYKPSKQTAIAFAVALEMPLEETIELLKKAGFALSHSNKFDIIIEYFIKSGNYNIYEINEALFAFDQKLLGM